MASIANLAVSLTANTSGFTRGMSRARGSVSGFSSAIASAKRMAAGFLGGYLSARGVMSAVNAYAEAEKATQGLSSALEMIGKNAPGAVADLQKFASSVQSVTTLDDEAVAGLMAYGARLGQFADEDLKKATVASIGLAKVLGIDTQSAMKLVTRAAAGQTSTLSRYGIVLGQNLSDQEKFNRVIEIGTRGFQLAKDETTTYSGRIQQMKNALNDAAEVIGGALAPSIGRLAEFISKNAVPAIEHVAILFRNWNLIGLSAGAAIIDAINAIVDKIGELTGWWEDGSELMATLWTNAADSIRVTWYMLMRDISAAMDETFQRAGFFAEGMAKATKASNFREGFADAISHAFGAVYGASKGPSERTRGYDAKIAEVSARLFPQGEMTEKARKLLEVAAVNPMRQALNEALGQRWEAPQFAMPGGGGIGMRDIGGGAAAPTRGLEAITSAYLTRIPGAANTDRAILDINKQQLAVAKDAKRLLEKIADEDDGAEVIE